MKKVPKSSKIYECKSCNYITVRESQFSRHILTAKHKNRTLRTEKVPKSSEGSFKCECGKEYNARNSLWYHKKKCDFNPENKINIDDNNENYIENDVEDDNKNDIIEQENEINYKDMFIEMMKQNQELHKTIHGMIPNIGNNNNNTITNNQFNLNLFLNEKCKDALNITDFVRSLEVNMNDLIQTGKLGYVDGISRIFVKALNDMDVTERPIHCTDIKRETVYIKDDNKWEKDNEDNLKLKKTIRNIENKNLKMLPKWQEENPDYINMESNKCNEFMELSIIALGGEDEKDKSEKKIMKNILKEVVIDKK
jgi:hypothetical protein